MRTRRSAWLTLAAALAGITAAAHAQEPANPHLNLGGRACTACHSTSGWSDVRFDHTRTGFPLRGQHQTAACASCHDLRDFRGAVRVCGSCHIDPHRGDAGQTCEQCHSEITWQVVRAENAHARTRLPELGVHASLRCEDCHRQRGVQQFTGQVAPCTACHQTTYDATTNPSHATLGFSTRCETCHQFTTWNFALFASHDAIFGIYSGRHAGVWRDCATCHTQPGNFSVFTCTQCHTQAPMDRTHQGIPGYGWDSPSCLGCHPQAGSGGLAFHDARFPILSGTHAGQWTACSDCHSSAADRQVYTCMGGACHPQATSDPGHTGMTGYQYVAAQCYSCHPDGRAGTFAQHDAVFPINTGTHAGQWAACTDCHTNPTDRQVYTCMGGACHPQAAADPGHSGIAGYQYGAAQCFSCHPDGRAGTFAQHDVIFPINSGTHAGKWAACADCHTNPATRQVYTCMGGACHPQAAVDPKHTGIPGYQYTAAQCLTCHPDGRVGTFTQHDVIFPIFSGGHLNRWSTCASCHTNPATRAVFTCTGSGCHSQAQMADTHRSVSGYTFDPAACLSCHPAGRAP